MSGGDAVPAVPSGFERHFRRSPATDPWEPIWSSKTPHGLTLGVRVFTAHCNARGLLHGGVISALADNAMGLSCAAVAGDEVGLLTVNLVLDFLGSASFGSWIEIEGRSERVGGAIAHASASIRADGEQIARASAVFRLLRRRSGE